MKGPGQPGSITSYNNTIMMVKVRSTCVGNLLFVKAWQGCHVSPGSNICIKPRYDQDLLDQHNTSFPLPTENFNLHLNSVELPYFFFSSSKELESMQKRD